MKKILITIILILISFTYVTAENKIYYDTVKGLEIVDVSGKKDIRQIEKEFNCSNLVDITKESLAKDEENKTIMAEKAKVENLIQEKIRELAISELKKEGKLDDKGDMIKEIK